ncbi:DUF4236 domain-containing protein [Coraliomargarita algicola]|uniref:DUF4236 domain-containing protein n=1 Tax=Coraliomargarita algicola TaxID=3092156 RepID=A0ABZ0RMR2_9BACT|nr:DUF4236 domain-containing protein [Coraliomargarita sp. J2-16]WPJ97514.1 DUF4236 domain-containing protein [Coraliomargarita sp. J2-16]
MGFYLRKSLRFGPVRFNLSKSGVGVSAGIKGFRVGSGPRGNYVHMGRGGVYYRKTLPAGRNGTSGSKQQAVDSHEQVQPSLPGDIVMDEIDSGDVGQIVDSSSSDLVEELTLKRKKTRYTPLVAVALGILGFVSLLNESTGGLFALTLIVAIPILIFFVILDRNRKTTVVFYEMDEVSEGVFKSLYDSFEQFKRCKKIWHIPSAGNVHDSKYHAGASRLVTRKLVSVSFTNPKFVKTNVPTPNFSVGTQQIYFFPDKILIFDNSGVGGLSFSNLIIERSPVRFIEDEGVPRDSQVVDRTWRYVNKKGGPDRRFKDNKELPIAEYDSVHLKSLSGLNELLYVSKVGAVSTVKSAVEASAKLLGA